LQNACHECCRTGGAPSGTSTAQDKPADAAAASVAVGPQYDTAHVYVVPEDVDRFSDSVIATFGGTRSQQAALTITPTPSRTMRQAKAAGATILVDPYTADRRQAAIVSFPGGYIAEIHSAASQAQAH
jgi:hypothetical protein